MKKNTFKVRGYEGISHLEFEEKDDLATILGKSRLLSIVNSYLTAHEWNSNFERGLVDLAVKAGHVRETEKGKDGKIVSTETFSSFLKRTGFKLNAKEAQALADGIAFPPVVQPREAKVDKDLVERLELARKLLESAEKLERFRVRVSKAETLDGEPANVEWPDFNGESTEDEDVAALAECIRVWRQAESSTKE